MPPPPVYDFSSDDGHTPTADAAPPALMSHARLATLLPDPWQPTQYTPAPFSATDFLTAMETLIHSPNITSSYLFRADILYDSDRDKSLALSTDAVGGPGSEHYRHLQERYRPKEMMVKGLAWRRTVVRELVPRNRVLDEHMVQTCHFFSSPSRPSTISSLGLGQDSPAPAVPGATTASQDQIGDIETTLVIYLPHIRSADAMPFYHPSVAGLCFAFTSTAFSAPSPTAILSLSLLPYRTHPLPSLAPKISRTTTILLATIAKLSKGAATGYSKRVHHDQLVPQRTFQETYARLKETYARRLVDTWIEDTDPAKHVFEDLAIAAFLIELWRGAYAAVPRCERGRDEGAGAFPGFVDVGCGNGLLVHLLASEGYRGWGFDVRRRRSWEMYGEADGRLVEGTMVPDVLAEPSDDGLDGGEHVPNVITETAFGRGAFIVSNHADELTAWTPLVAYLNDSSFVAIPCCSHDFGGRRYRAPAALRRDKAGGRRREEKRTDGTDGGEAESKTSDGDQRRQRQAAETGSLRRRTTAPSSPEASDFPSPAPADGHGTDETDAQATAETKQHKPPKPPSAYASLCNYVSLLAAETGYEPRTEMLRIPSTRNACVVGLRKGQSGLDAADVGTGAVGAGARDGGDARQQRRREEIARLVEREAGETIEEIRRAWLERAGLIASKKTLGSGGHR